MTTTATTNRIDAAFARAAEQGRAASVFYVTAGYPNVAATPDVLRGLDDAGADVIELGVPFSDPIADGPTIQKASQASLDAGTKVRDVFALASEFRRGSETALLFFTAYNPVLRMGLDAFADAAADAGADGVLVPDLPPEEADDLKAACDRRGLRLVFLVAPTTSPARRAAIGARSGGFVYYISLRGVTGARADLPADMVGNVQALKAATSLPVAVGFGVSTPEHAARVAGVADGFVVGSALIDAIAANRDRAKLRGEVRAFAEPLVKAAWTGA